MGLVIFLASLLAFLSGTCLYAVGHAGGQYLVWVFLASGAILALTPVFLWAIDRWGRGNAKH